MKKLLLGLSFAIVLAPASAFAQTYPNCIRFSMNRADGIVGADKRDTQEWRNVQGEELEKCLAADDVWGNPDPGQCGLQFPGTPPSC